MASKEVRDEVAILSSQLASLPENMHIFSLSMRSLFSVNAVGTGSGTAKFRKLRDDTREDAVVYVKCILPIVQSCVADIQDYFEIYEALSMPEWWENLDDIIQETHVNREACRALISIHKDMLTTLKSRQDQAAVLVHEMKDLAAEYEKEVKELKASANAKNGWALALVFIPIVNVIASPILSASASKDMADSVAKAQQSNIQLAAAKVVTDVLVPALGKFIEGLEQIAGFFQVIHQELTSFQKKGENARHADRPKMLHYSTMRLKAKDIKTGCRGFYAVLPSIQTDFEAIPIEGTDQNYVDRWLEDQKKKIQMQFSIKGLSSKIFKSLTSKK